MSLARLPPGMLPSKRKFLRFFGAVDAKGLAPRHDGRLSSWPKPPPSRHRVPDGGPAPTPRGEPDPTVLPFLKREYYVWAESGEPVGPVSIDQIARGIVHGKVPLQAYVTRPGETKWQKILDVPDIARALEIASNRRSSDPLGEFDDDELDEADVEIADEELAEAKEDSFVFDDVGEVEHAEPVSARVRDTLTSGDIVLESSVEDEIGAAIERASAALRATPVDPLASYPSVDEVDLVPVAPPRDGTYDASEDGTGLYDASDAGTGQYDASAARTGQFDASAAERTGDYKAREVAALVELDDDETAGAGLDPAGIEEDLATERGPRPVPSGPLTPRRLPDFDAAPTTDPEPDASGAHAEAEATAGPATPPAPTTENDDGDITHGRALAPRQPAEEARTALVDEGVRELREDPVTAALAKALSRAAEDGRWDVVLELARQLDARKPAAPAPDSTVFFLATTPPKPSN